MSEPETNRPAYLRPMDGRLVLLLVVVAFGIAMMTIWSADRSVVWRSLGVPALVPEFADARVITSGWECSRLGFDVLAKNPCDPWGRPMNYPRLWTLPAALGAGQDSTSALAIVFSAAFIMALLALVGRLTIGWAALYALAVASPSVLLAIERGNNDLVTFALVAGSSVSLARRRFAAAWAVLLAATALKLYPVASIGVLRRSRMRTRLVVLLALTVYAAVTLQDIRLIVAGTPRFAGWSYGLTTNAATLLPSPPVAVATAALALTGVTAALLLARGLRTVSADPKAEAAFIGGASIYLATYVLGPSWDYRLIFLLLTMPMAIGMARSRRPAFLVITMLVLWLSCDAGSPLFVVDQLAQAVLAVALLAFLLNPLVTRRRPSLPSG
jgi:hypothetical protein